MFPQHFQTMFLAVLSLVMGAHISWPVTLEQSSPEGQPGNPVAVAPAPSSASTSETLPDPLHEGKSDASSPYLPVGFSDSEISQNAAPGPSQDQESRVPPEAQLSLAEYSPASLDYFTEIGFGVEYGASTPVLHKWTEDVRIKVHGTPTRTDLEVLDQVLTELNSLLSDVRLQATDEGSNLEVYFVPERLFATVEPGYVPVNLGFFRVWWDDAGAIHRGRVLIASQGITQQERSHLIREELTQSLGLFKDSWQYPDSVFYQGWTDITSYSDLDRATIRLLYNPHLGPGMTQNEVLEVLGAGSSALCCRD